MREPGRFTGRAERAPSGSRALTDAAKTAPFRASKVLRKGLGPISAPFEARRPDRLNALFLCLCLCGLRSASAALLFCCWEALDRKDAAMLREGLLRHPGWTILADVVGNSVQEDVEPKNSHYCSRYGSLPDCWLRVRPLWGYWGCSLSDCWLQARRLSRLDHCQAPGVSAGCFHWAEKNSYPLQPTADAGQSVPDLHLGALRRSGLQGRRCSAALRRGLPDCFPSHDLCWEQPGFRDGLRCDHPARLDHWRSGNLAVGACVL